MARRRWSVAWAAGGRQRCSARSARATSDCRAGPSSADSEFGFKRFGAVGGIGVQQQAHAQFRLLQRLLAMTEQADAALERGKRFVEAQLAAFHPGDQLLQLVERVFEID